MPLPTRLPAARRLMLAAVPALAIATAALAQPAGPPDSPREGPRGARAEAFHARHDAMVKQHQDDLRTILRLRPDQEGALAAFAAAHQHPRFDKERGERDRPPAQTTPERLQEMARRDAEMQAARQQRRDALAKFYAALSPDQQKVFDALQRLEHGPHGGPGRGGHGGRMMMSMPGGPDGMMGHGMMGHGGPGPHDDD